jgi:uncharacterized membrane protein
LLPVGSCHLAKLGPKELRQALIAVGLFIRSRGASRTGLSTPANQRLFGGNLSQHHLLVSVHQCIAFAAPDRNGELGSGLVAGVFFAFSTFVMTALARLPAPHGIAAMQSINIAVNNPMFLATFLGTAVACAALVVAALSSWTEPRAAYLLTGGLLYLVGAVLVTIVFNVPRNDALAAVDPNNTEAATLWIRYIASWTAWNHLRGAAALAATGSLTLATRMRRQYMFLTLPVLTTNDKCKRC